MVNFLVVNLLVGVGADIFTRPRPSTCAFRCFETGEMLLRPRVRNSPTIEIMKMKPGGYIKRPKLFPSRSVEWNDVVICLRNDVTVTKLVPRLSKMVNTSKLAIATLGF